METEGLQVRRKYYFIDESGDPNFYGFRKKPLMDTEGFQPYLIIGMIETEDRNVLRNAVAKFISDIKNDVLYNSIHSIATDSNWFLHARRDHAEVRIQFFELLRKLDGYHIHVVIAKKDPDIFREKYHDNATDFYFDVLMELLRNNLDEGSCQIFLSDRQKNSIARFHTAVKISMENEKLSSCELNIVASKDFPELSVVDYMLWAIQRKLVKGEGRYFEALRSKFGRIKFLNQ